MPGWRVGVDIGGTFTDIVFLGVDGALHTTKVSSSVDNYARAIVAGMAAVWYEAGLSGGDIVEVLHGTTVTSNAILELKGARTGLITTKGFRDILEIARGNRPDPFDLHYQRDEPLIPRELRLEVRERIGSKGEMVEPLDLPAFEKLAAKLNELHVESIAIFFMNSYVNPAHEEAAAETLRRFLPGVYVTFSTDLTREWYEYERCSTVAANAYVGPLVNTYIRRLGSEFQKRSFVGSLFMMGSNGGLLSAERTCRQPIGLVESGPIGGCIGASA